MSGEGVYLLYGGEAQGRDSNPRPGLEAGKLTTTVDHLISLLDHHASAEQMQIKT